MRRVPTTLLLAGALLLGGCFEAPLSGHFGPTAYYHVDDHYRVRYGEDTSERLLPDGWVLQDFASDAEGRPGRYVATRANVERIELSRYLRLRRPVEIHQARWDLRFTRGERRVIFVRTLPLRAPWTQDTLPDLMLRSAVSIGAVGADGPDLLGTPPEVLNLRVHLVEQGAASVDGREAYFVTFDRQVADGQIPIHTERVTLVGVRSRVSQPLGNSLRAPELVVFGLITTPADRAADLEHFSALVRRVDFAPTF